MKFIWRRINVGFGKETTRGTAVTASKWVPKTNVTFDQKVTKIADDSSIGVIHDSIDAQPTKQWAEGDVEMNLYVNAIGLLLLNVFWSVTSTTDTTGAYKHTFNVLESNQSPSLTVCVADENQDYQYPNAMVDSLEIQGSVDKFVTIKTAIKAKPGTASTDTPSYTADNVLMGRHISIKTATNLAGLSAGTAINCSAFTISVNKNLAEDPILGSIIPNDFCNTEFAVEGSLELLYNDVTMRDLVNNDTIKALRIEAKDTATTIGLTSNPRLMIDLTRVKFTEFSKSMGNKDLVKQTIKFKGLYSMADSKAMLAELVNTTATY